MQAVWQSHGLAETSVCDGETDLMKTWLSVLPAQTLTVSAKTAVAFASFAACVSQDSWGGVGRRKETEDKH